MPMLPHSHSQDRGGIAPSINPPAVPRRHQRSRKKGAPTPDGVLYCGRPTIRGNPFDARRFGHARSVRLYRQWIEGQLGHRRLNRLGFSDAEVAQLSRWRRCILAAMPDLRGRDLQCWCPLSSRWCHVDVLLEKANG